MPSACWGHGGTFPLVRVQGHSPRPHPVGQRRIPGGPSGDRWLGEEKPAQTVPTRVQTPCGPRWGQGRGATEEGPQVAPIPPPPLRSPGHSQRPDRNQPPALTTLPKPRRAPGGSKVTAAGRSPPPKRLAPALAAASTSATAEPPPIPRRSGAPSPGAGSRASSAASPGAGPAPLCPQDRSLGRGPSAESWGRARGPGDRASLPGAEVSARGTGGAGAGGFISPGGVRLLTERARCTAPLQHGNAAPEGGARLRGAQGYGARGRARARRERERRMRRGSEPQRRRDETRPERGSAGRERKRTEAGGGRRGGQRDMKRH